MIKLLTPDEFGREDLVPHAIIQRSVSAFSKSYELEFIRDADDLDGFSVLYLDLGGKKAALIHYDGEPEDTITIYLPRRLTQQGADRAVNKILKEYRLHDDAISWRETLHERG